MLNPTNNAKRDLDQSTSWNETHSPGKGEPTLKSHSKKTEFCPQTRLVLQPLGLGVSSSGSPNLSHGFLSMCQDSTITILWTTLTFKMSSNKMCHLNNLFLAKTSYLKAPNLRMSLSDLLRKYFNCKDLTPIPHFKPRQNASPLDHNSSLKDIFMET